MKSKNLGGISEKISYIPGVELIKKLGVGYEPKPPTNLSLVQIDELVADGDVIGERVGRLDYSNIARAADMTESSLAFILRQILLALESVVKKNHNVKLNVRVGFIKIRQAQIMFENLAAYGDDKISQSSCNTSFKVKKVQMTGQSGTIFDKRSRSIRDDISLRSKPQTPQNHSTRSISRKGELIFGRADPNTIDLKQTER